MDDILVFSRTEGTHLKQLTAVLSRLKNVGLKLKPQSVVLFNRVSSILGIS